MAVQSIRGPRVDRRQPHSYGCINVPVAFFDGVILPAFNNSNGVVYILPEDKSLAQVFAMARHSELARLGV